MISHTRACSECSAGPKASSVWLVFCHLKDNPDADTYAQRPDALDAHGHNAYDCLLNKASQITQSSTLAAMLAFDKSCQSKDRKFLIECYIQEKAVLGDERRITAHPDDVTATAVRRSLMLRAIYQLWLYRPRPQTARSEPGLSRRGRQPAQVRPRRRRWPQLSGQRIGAVFGKTISACTCNSTLQACYTGRDRREQSSQRARAPRGAKGGQRMDAQLQRLHHLLFNA